MSHAIRQKNICLLSIVLIGVLQPSIAQFSITGSTCVLAGQSYQYTISGPWTQSTTMTWTVSGGVITTPSCGNCTQKTGTPLPNIYISWSSSGSLTLTTSNPTGNASKTITISLALSPGSITSNGTQYINYNSTPATITCSAATGGSCTPSYSYQWQSSTDNVNFSDISGATSQDLSFSAGLTQTKYFRRKVTETTSSTVGYSNTATVFVYPQVIGGSIAPASQTINFNTTPSSLTLSGVSGGTGVYTYQWQSAPDANNWVSIPGAITTTYSPPALKSVIYYRVAVTSNGAVGNSSSAVINVNPQLLPGTISPLYISIYSGTAPGPIMGITFPTGGACGGTYSYQWQSSTDGTNFTNISGATSQNYTPGTLSTTTWYRRTVTCGTDVTYTTSCKVVIITATSDINFIRVRDMLKAGVADSATAYGLNSVYDVSQSAQYFDGLGRPLQTVGMMQSPLQKDIVSFSVYDEYGRESVKYLPYPSTTTDGNFKMTSYTDAYNFNNTQFAGEQNYYSQVNYEPSPANRPSITFSAGLNWVGLSRGVATQYLVNTVSDSVRIWSISAAAGSIPTTTSSYAAGLLLKNVTIDEHNHQMVEYKDMNGTVVLKKVQLPSSPGTGHVGWLCTYYVYDDVDNLRLVIQPRCVELINSNWTISTALSNELCFRYEYDARKRMMIKKIAGAGEVWMVYDARDRLVMSQDSLLRLSGKWMVMEYDSLNRPWRTGLLTDANNRAYHQNLAGTSISYPNTSANYEVLTQTYYDDYGSLSIYFRRLSNIN